MALLNAIQVIPELYSIPLGGVNAFLIDSDELVLVDTGVPNSTDQILGVIQAINRSPDELRHILVTHCHPDHAGSLAELKKRTGAMAYMHPVDAANTRAGMVPPGPFSPAPGMEEMFRKFIGFESESSEYEPADVENEIQDSDMLSIAGGIRVIHAPGHSAGQIVFLWEKHGGVLFAADVASNMMGLSYSLGYADIENAKRDLLKLSALHFEIACFSHGEAITQGASAKFKQKWGRQ